MTAASSVRPNAPGAPSVRGRNRVLMSSNSSLTARSRLVRETLARANVPGDGVQGAVDESGLGRVEEGLGQLDILVDHHLCRYVRTVHQLEGARAEDGANRGVQALELPALRQPAHDRLVDGRLLRHDAPDDLAEEGLVGLGQDIL